MLQCKMPVKNLGNQDYMLKVLFFHRIRCVIYRRICKRKTRFMSMCRQMIVFILRLPNMTNNLQLELKKWISYLFIFHFSSKKLLQYFCCSGMWHSITEKRGNFYVSPHHLRLELEFCPEDFNGTHADHSLVSDVNFSVNSKATTLYQPLSEFSSVYKVNLYIKTNKKTQLAIATQNTRRGRKAEKMKRMLLATVMTQTQSSAKNLVIRHLYFECLFSFSGVVESYYIPNNLSIMFLALGRQL